MAVLKEGTVVLITKGADAGKKAEVVAVEGSMLTIKVGNRQRRISFRHVEPLKV